MYREKLLNRYACSSNSIDHCAGRELIKQVFFQVPTKMPSGYATVCPTLSCFYSSFSRLGNSLFSVSLQVSPHSSPRHAYLVVAKNRPCHGHRRHFKKLKPHKRSDDELRTMPTNERISASSRYRH